LVGVAVSMANEGDKLFVHIFGLIGNRIRSKLL